MLLFVRGVSSPHPPIFRKSSQNQDSFAFGGGFGEDRLARERSVMTFTPTNKDAQ